MTNEERKIIGERFEQIADKHDRTLTPSAVVDDAKSASSPLHKYFEWNDARAAHQARLERAREMIRAVPLVIHESVEKRVIVVPRWIHDPDAGKSQGYVHMQVLREDPDRGRRALIEECRRAADILHRVKKVARGLCLEGAVDDILAMLSVVIEKAERKNSRKRRRKKK